jgi:ubiquitin-activating enzyme E1
MSNLNRQFLFRKEDIGKSKSLVACHAIKKMNPEFNCASTEKKVAKETEDIFDENFWKRKDYIICGLDNIKARNYVNKICHKYNKSFLDAGTNGTKGRITVVVPFDTIPMEFTETNTKNYAMCTLKNFPSQIEHCIEWSKMNFIEIFNQNILHFKNFINNSTEDFLNRINELAKKDYVEKIRTIESYMNLMDGKNEGKILEKIIYRAIEYYDEFYNKKIKELLKLNPPDKKTEKGEPFWNAIKRAPQPIEEIDFKNDKMTNLFIISFIHIYSKCLGIKSVKINEKKIIEIIKEFKSNKANKINEDNNNDFIEDENQFNAYKEEKTQEIKKYKELIRKNMNIYGKIKEEYFEKDGLDNYHIEFIESSSNLRARNYYIEPADTNKTLMIAGSIIQALPTTTAAVSGYLALELLALMNNEKQNANMDLSCNMFYYYPPSKYVPKPKPEPIKINKSMTSQEFLDYCRDNYEYDVYSYYINDKNCFTRKIFKEFEKTKDRYKKYMKNLNTKIEDNYNSNLPNDKKLKNFIIQIYAYKLNQNQENESIGSEETEDELPLVEYNPFKTEEKSN